MNDKSKSALRTHFRSLRKQVGDVDFNFMAQAIKQLLENKTGYIAGYFGYGSELPFHQIMKMCPELKWVLPRVEGHDLSFYTYSSFAQLTKNHWGIPEPDPHEDKKVELNQCEAVFIPAVAFDQLGGRLGSGKGFYDRALEGVQILKVGVGYAIQHSTEPLPSEPHDIKMDVLLNEKFIQKPIR